MARQLTNDDSNPAGALAAASDMLMQILDPNDLAEKAIEIVANTHFSKRNRLKFDKAIADTRHDLVRLQGYLWNFMLAADGHSVL